MKRRKALQVLLGCLPVFWLKRLWGKADKPLSTQDDIVPIRIPDRFWVYFGDAVPMYRPDWITRSMSLPGLHGYINSNNTIHAGWRRSLTESEFERFKAYKDYQSFRDDYNSYICARDEKLYWEIKRKSIERNA